MAHEPSSTVREPAAEVSSLPSEAIAFAGRMFEAARSGQLEVFQLALAQGLPANLTNDKGDTLVGLHIEEYRSTGVNANV